METNKTEQHSVERTEDTPVTSEASSVAQADVKLRQTTDQTVKSSKCKKPKVKADGKQIKKPGKPKKGKQVVTSDEESSSESSEASVDSDESSDSSSESDSDSEKEKRKRKAKKAKQKAKEKKKAKSRRRTRKEESSGSESEVDSENEESMSDSEDNELQNEEEELQQLLRVQQMQQQMQQMQQLQSLPPPIPHQPPHHQQLGGWPAPPRPAIQLDFGAGATATRLQAVRNARHLKAMGLDQNGKQLRREREREKEKKPKKKRGSKMEYKRVDQLWDNTIHNYKLQDTAEDVEDEYDQYLFNVRRTFDWEGKYKTTVVDIKSKLLKESLNEVMEGVKGVSLVEESPVVDPNLLFLYLEDLKNLSKDLKSKIRGGERMKRKVKKRNELKIKHLKVLTKYLDKDYADVKKTLYPMLESGLITFELLWALYKPNTLAYTSTYGTTDEPRAFKIEYAEKEVSFMRGEWYNIEGRYLEYDGKNWGFGSMDADVPSFKGARKITSLNCYPLKYHRDEGKIRQELITRGKKFVALQGVHYKSHEGLAYYKKKRSVIKVNINGRVMVDPAIHRRILPNYQVSTVKPKEEDDVTDSSDEYDSDDEGDGDDSDEGGQSGALAPLDGERTKTKVVFDENNKPRVVDFTVDKDGNEVKTEKNDLSSEESDKDDDDKKALPVFSDEEYLIASPVVLGFAFAEKLWLEFTVSGIKDIEWNDQAYKSLVLEANTKDIVKALVESHKYHPAESIDDVIQGKGKGLVAVLHGPPGTGKTLTAEGISELLKCPLYMVSAGELGTDPRTLEAELQKILDIAHAWGAVLLLDEADVFLEKRTIQDIHRNALVSIFLRLLEYFQGILFLTTNRVETFDDAFQSRIHIALRYGDLNLKAKKAVFKMFIEKACAHQDSQGTQAKLDVVPFSDADYTSLARHSLNGRQIKNTVRTAQALAVNKKEPLSMEHIKRVLDVALAFDRDLKGGPGFQEAMRGYM